MARLAGAATRVLRPIAAPFLLAAPVLLGPLCLLFRRMDASHGLPMPRAGGAP
ncbi:MAG: hypothetical protein QXO51_00555 [Halobacteria archaeon]